MTSSGRPAGVEAPTTHASRTLEDMSDAYYTVDRDWRFTYVNRQAARLMQRTRADLVGRVLWDAFPGARGSVFETEFRRAVRTGEDIAFEQHFAPLDLWVAVRAFPSDGGLAVYFLDIGDRRAKELALVESERRYRTLFERAGDAILIADDQGRYIDANEAAAVLLGMPRDEIIGKALNDFVIDTVDHADAAAGWAAFLTAGEMRGEVRLRRPDGAIREAEFVAVANMSAGTHCSVLRDVTDRRDHERSVVQRVRILEALRRLSSRAEPEETADAICAEIVDHADFPSAAIFAFGTERASRALGARFRDDGDAAAIPELSPRRLAHLKAKATDGPWVDDWSGRYDSTARAAMDLLHVRAAIFAPIESEGQLLGVLVAGSDETAAELESRTPALMEFAALASSLLGPGLRRLADRGAERARIRAVISGEAFKPVFQPITDLTTGRTLGFEALTRFVDGTPPDQAFLSAAAVGIGLELEEATLKVALAAATELPADCFLAVNVSPDLVMSRARLAALLPRSKKRLILEITEHASVTDYAALREAVATLGRDVRLSVDDAGAGFASLRHILELAPSHVKLDRALISRVDADPARQALVAGMVHFANAIAVTLIAEGVETRAEQETLVRLGVRVGQGYLFGRPASIGERRIVPPVVRHTGARRPRASALA